MSEDVYQSPYSAFKHEMFGRDGDPYFADDGLVAAANAAYALERPLLLTGEPGCGKTDFAYAAATGLYGKSPKKQSKPLEYFVRSDTTASDMLYRYDSIRRFSDAQTDAAKQRASLPQNYITLEPLGEALISKEHRVVLIDEIDKAQRDLPNDLLRELDDGDFEIAEIDAASNMRHGEAEPGHQHLRRAMTRPAGAQKPLVIITSNVERQLPDAFLRRCLFYYVPFPSSDRLVQILNSRFSAEEGQAETHTQAVKLFEQMRTEQAITKKPATAELVDWVKCLTTVFDPQLVQSRLSAQTAKVDAKDIVQWSALPGMSCLVKLREDMASLGLEDVRGNG